MNTFTGDKIAFLQTVNFKLTIDSTKYGNFEYFVQTVALPGVSNGEVSLGVSNKPGYVPGDRPSYEVLSIKFVVSEDMKNYEELLNWLVSLSSVEPMPIADLRLHVLTAQNTVNRQLVYRNAFPTSLSAIEFDVTTSSDVQYATCTATFRYDRFEFDR